jgi:hypothetical protein
VGFDGSRFLNQAIMKKFKEAWVIRVANATDIYFGFSHPKERLPFAAYFLRSSVLLGVGKRNIPIPLPTCGVPAAPRWAVPTKTCDTRRGKRVICPISESRTYGELLIN